MRNCKRHPSQSPPGGGVCAICLQERLLWLWRGESFRVEDDLTSQQSEGDDAHAPARPSVGFDPDVSSVRIELQVNEAASEPIPSDGTNADTTTNAKKADIIVEWAEFHAQRRRRKQEVEASSTSSASSLAQISRSLDSLEFKRLLVDNNTDRSSRSRSMPLDNRSAEETALRVIGEVQEANDHSGELDYLDDHSGVQMLPERQQQLRGRKILFWQSPRWVMKLLVTSPATTPSQNSKKKVFPSRVGTRKRLARFNSADWNHPDPNWMESSLQGMPQLNIRKVDMEKHQRRTNVFSWLQDADRTKIKRYEPTGMSAAFPGSAEAWRRDLTTVGHLHEIAEELEESDKDEVAAPNVDSLRNISSFGIFLHSAAQRQPQAGLTRASSAAA